MSQLNVNTITDRSGAGAPTFPNGIVVTGLITATTLNQNVVGVITASTFQGGDFIGAGATFSGNVSIGGSVTDVLTLGSGAVVVGTTTTTDLIIENSALTAITTTSINKLLVNREFCTVYEGASAITITLPASPSPGWEVGVGIAGTFKDTVVGRNGNNIMGLSEDFTINIGNISISLLYINNTYGWKVI
jgi:hypothetical protein